MLPSRQKGLSRCDDGKDGEMGECPGLSSGPMSSRARERQEVRMRRTLIR
jgi:hypothetical protein